MFFIDLDQFKYVNDTCGHVAGDDLLKLAAQQIRHGVRTEDFVARFGGDEFVVLLKDISRQDAKAVATQVLELMRSVKHVEQDRVFNLQCSIGIAAISSERFSAHELIAQADIACQTAKSHGRNRVEVYSVAEKRSEQMAKDVDWMQRIRTALDTDGFVLYYQPLLHIKSGRISHYEALLRLKADDQLVSPQTFLPAAVRFGLMADIDRWVLGSAVRALAEFGAEDPNLRLSVNLSSFAFEDEGLAAHVREPAARARRVGRQDGARDHRAARRALRREDRPPGRDAARPRLPDRDRRLRHGLQLVQLPEAPAGRLPQDRRLVHQGHRP